VKAATPKTPVYLRQSKDSDHDELAISRQRRACLALCAEKGWTNTADYPDTDRSATNGKEREQYQRLLADIAAGRVGRVVVWDLDRLHRQPIELEHFMRLADEKKIAPATVTGSD
jgi:DNA invertase Pin-like site-specific DNA recombinase